MIGYLTNKLAGCVGATKTTRNHIGIHGSKYRSYESWCKEGKKKNRNILILMEQKSFYFKVVLQQVFEITVRSRLASLTGMMHGILDFLEDSSRQSCSRWC
ncbi:hypothetical protein TNCV_966371 [Trichonephila clavipes]|nr:hypothetical protein TNCV_966371 [Trichonephila clavipes]